MSTSLAASPSAPDSVETDVFVDCDRRCSPRRDCHTLVTAVTSQHPEESDGWRVMKVRSEDVSVTGAKLVSTDPLPGKQVYLRFLLPTFGEQYVEAEIVNQTIRDRVSLNGAVTRLFTYGVKFTGVVSDETVLPPQRAAAETAAC